MIYEELTNEALVAMERCGEDIGDQCADCPAKRICHAFDALVRIKFLAAALLEERAKPKYNVWKNAPDWATSAEVFWESQAQGKRRTGPVFTREIPKTRARIMAEEIASAHISNKDDLIDIIEQTINAHMEELKGEA